MLIVGNITKNIKIFILQTSFLFGSENFFMENIHQVKIDRSKKFFSVTENDLCIK